MTATNEQIAEFCGIHIHHHIPITIYDGEPESEIWSPIWFDANNNRLPLLPDFNKHENWEKYVFPKFPDVITWKKNSIWYASFSPLYQGTSQGNDTCSALREAIAPIIEGGKN